ncbi:MAG: EamA family transporter [Planctomycetota bacterium]
MFVFGVLSALWAAGTWALGSVYVSRALRARGAPTALAANTFKNSLALAAFLLLLPLVGGAWPEPRSAALLVLSGVLGFALGDSLYFAALTRCGIQTAATVALLYVPLAALLDRLAYGATLAAWQVLGMVLTLGGVLLVVTDPRTRGEDPAGSASAPGAKRAGVLLSLGVVVVIACAVVLGHGESGSAGVIPMAVLRMAGAVLAAGPIACLLGVAGGRSPATRPRPAVPGLRGAPGAPTSGALAVGAPAVRAPADGAPADGAPALERIRAELARTFRPIGAPAARSRALWIASGLAVAGLVPYHFALRELPGGVGAILFATTPLFTLLLGRLSGERFGPRGLVGTLLGFAGVALVVLAQR